MNDRSSPRRGPKSLLLAAVGLLLCLSLGSCQYLQNEFFHLNRASPPPESEESHRPW